MRGSLTTVTLPRVNASTWVTLWLLSVIVGVPLALASAAALSSLGATDADELLTRLRKLLLSGNREGAERLVARANDAPLRLARTALTARLPVSAESVPTPDPELTRVLLRDALLDERQAIDTWWALGLLGALPTAALLVPVLRYAEVHRPIVVGVTAVALGCAGWATHRRARLLAGLSALSEGLAGFVRSELQDDREDPED